MNKTAVDRLVRIEVLAEPVIPGRSGVKDGRPWTIPTKQSCAIWQDEPFPTRLEVVVPDTGPYKPGFYLLAGKPLGVSAVNNRVVVSFDDRAVALIPVAEVAAALAEMAGDGAPPKVAAVK